jgi:glycosyltransferase involved in cell wall biosynthesis
VKVLIISTFEFSGGAARSANRLYLQLKRMGVDCRMLVQYKQSDDPFVFSPEGWFGKRVAKLRPYLDGLPLLCYRSRLSPPWSLAWLPKNIEAEVASYAPDVIHLHGTGHGFLSISAIRRLARPLIWTLHDSWAFTGGCHLPGTCNRYLGDCGRCPQLNMRHEHDLSRWVWQRKSRYWPQLNVSFVAPSQWIADCAHASSLLSSYPIEMIPNGIDTTQFTPANRISARAALGLPKNGMVLLFGASSFTLDKNKGFEHLKSALFSVGLSLPEKNLTLALFGDQHYRDAEIAGIPVCSYGPIISDDQLISLYRAADLFVLPSLQENLPNTVMEAMACGTPCVAFSVGGVGDLIDHKKNGILIKPLDINGLVDTIVQVLGDREWLAMLGRQARRNIEDCFSLKMVASRHLNHYRRIISETTGSVSHGGVVNE